MLTSDLLKPAPAKSVTVEYDSRGARTTKVFTGANAGYQARSFYANKYKQGKNPKVVSATAN